MARATRTFWLVCALAVAGLVPVPLPAGVVEPHSAFELGRTLGNLYGKALYCGLDKESHADFRRRAIAAIDHWARGRRDRFDGVKEFSVRAATGFKYGPRWIDGETCPGILTAFDVYAAWLRW